MAELVGLSERSVQFRCILREALKNDPVLLELEINPSEATAANDVVATVKPSEKFNTLMAAFLAGNPDANSRGGLRSFDIDRKHDGPSVPTEDPTS